MNIKEFYQEILIRRFYQLEFYKEVDKEIFHKSYNVHEIRGCRINVIESKTRLRLIKKFSGKTKCFMEYIFNK